MAIVPEWKDIQGYENYSVSSCGKVFSKKNNLLLRPYTNECGYLKVVLYGKLRKTFSVHRLVGLAFLEPVAGAKDLNHINGIKTDNSLGNLEWTTSKENTVHAFSIGLRTSPKGEFHGMAKLTSSDVREIREIRRTKGLSHPQIGKMFNVKHGTIRDLLAGRTWSHIV